MRASAFVLSVSFSSPEFVTQQPLFMDEHFKDLVALHDRLHDEIARNHVDLCAYVAVITDGQLTVTKPHSLNL